MTPDIMHIALGGGCLVMTGMTLHLYRLLADAAPKARKWDRLCAANKRNAGKRHRGPQQVFMATTDQLKLAAADRSAKINRERVRLGL